ncbi:MAG TPA: aspartate kinase [Gammaproteobacteria bacterium]|nr:aspartate kinase [Gammaproteobacteria bacterium]
MSIIVQKFGGSSVADEDHIRLVARRVCKTKRQGHDVVVVVSAMGSTTNDLLGMANRLCSDPEYRELDMLLSAGERVSMALLAIALQDMGRSAISLTGPQAGILTTDDYFNARIEAVNPKRIRDELLQDKIVVVAGYQGMNKYGEVTTLGRGGSDTTAVALAAALDAEYCEICSDVDGVYSADPRVVDDASRLDDISHEEMLELARYGAKVLSPRAVEYAHKNDLELRARSTFSNEPGTTVAKSHDVNGDGEDSIAITGVASHRNLLWLQVKDNVILDDVAKELTGATLFLDEVRDDGGRDLLVPAKEIAEPEAMVERLGETFGERIDVRVGIGSVSGIGLGVGDSRELLEYAHKLLTDAGVTVHASWTTDHALTCLVDSDEADKSLVMLHQAFIDVEGEPGNEAFRQARAKVNSLAG